MPTITIYHNPNCSKSRATLALLNELGITPQIICYLAQPPSVATLTTLQQQLGFSSARELMRTQDDLYTELALADDKLSEAQLLAALHRHPQLLARPIVVANGQARIGRPPQQVLTIL